MTPLSLRWPPPTWPFTNFAYTLCHICLSEARKISLRTRGKFDDAASCSREVELGPHRNTVEAFSHKCDTQSKMVLPILFKRWKPISVASGTCQYKNVFRKQEQTLVSTTCLGQSRRSWSLWCKCCSRPPRTPFLWSCGRTPVAFLSVFRSTESPNCAHRNLEDK